MKIKLMTIDVLDVEPHQRELNTFLASHKILALTKELLQIGDRAYWLFCVEYAESAGSTAGEMSDKKPKTDYKDLLSDEDFEIFSKLRDVRKEIAERDEVPVYVVLTNAQLAEIVQNRVHTREALSAIKGIGQSRVDRFGDELLVSLRSVFEETRS